MGAGFVLAVLAVMAQGCNEAYNPSFRNLFGDSDDAIRRGAMPRGPGWFTWNISWDDDIEVDGAAKSVISITETPGGPNLLTLPDNWAAAGTTSYASQLQLEADTYYLKVYLVKSDAYVLENEIITIRKDKTTSFEKAFTAANGYWTPYPQLTVKAQFATDAPVAPSQAAFAFYSDADCTNQYPERGNLARSVSVPSLAGVVRSDGWTALPPGSASFYVKVSLTDTQGRVFHRVRGPYSTMIVGGTPVEIAVGAAAAAVPDPNQGAKPFTLLRKIEVDPTLNGGTFEFSQVGSDGRTYTAAAGYQGAEAMDDYPAVGLVQVSEAGVQTGKALNEIEVQTDPGLGTLPTSGQLTQTGSGFTFKMPQKGGASAPVTWITGAFVTAGVVSMKDDALPDTPSKLQFGLKNSLYEAIDVTGPQTAIITILQDIETTATYGTASPIVIPEGSNITLTVPASKAWKIKSGLLPAMLFRVHGKLTLSAGQNGSLTLDGNSAAGDPIITVEDTPLAGPDDKTLIINDGVTLKNAAIAAVQSQSAVFKMNGGIISDSAEAVILVSGALEMSGDAQIPKGAVPNRNGIKVNDAGSLPVKITAPLSSRSAQTEIVPFSYNDTTRALINGDAADYANFCVRADVAAPDPGVAKPYLITEAGYLYGPEIRAFSPTVAYYQRVQDAVDAAPNGSPMYTALTKSIEIGRGITVPANKTIDISTPSAGGSITRAAGYSGTLFSISGALVFSGAPLPLIINGNVSAVPSSSPLISVDAAAGSLTLNGAVEIKDNAGAGVYSAGNFLIDPASSVNVNNVVELADGKTMQIMPGSGTGSLAKIKPVYPASGTQQVLSDSSGSLASNYTRVSIVPQAVTGGSRTWLVNDSGMLYLNLNVSLALPPGATDFTLTVPAAGRIARNSAITVNTSGVTLDAPPTMDINGTPQTVSWTSPNASITVPPTLAYGQHTVTIWLKRSGAWYSKDFSIYVMQ